MINIPDRVCILQIKFDRTSWDEDVQTVAIDRKLSEYEQADTLINFFSAKSYNQEVLAFLKELREYLRFIVSTPAKNVTYKQNLATLNTWDTQYINLTDLDQ